jgi:membrane protease YdiL (CAAX protease family)
LNLPLPATQILASLAVSMFVAFLIGALGEELGWSGYITGARLQLQWRCSMRR